eukprot:jgi/Picsp_1/2342/NSC_05805-R1_surface antigen protein 2
MIAATRMLSAACVLLLLGGQQVYGQTTATDSEQQDALLLLRAAIDRKGALVDDWIPSKDVCEWTGITCGANGEVVVIDLQDKGLEGQLPLDEGLWSSLSSVKNINLANNAIDGFLPPQMSAVTSLEYIALRDNNLESVLPVSWESLSSLKGVDLSGNKLFGDLPPEWSQLVELQSVDLSSNQFTGAIPESWNSFPNLVAASLANNEGLCKDNADDTSTDIPIFYGPCDAESPQLPDVNPTYPPAPVLSPPPAPSPDAVSPSPVVESPSPAEDSPPPIPILRPPPAQSPSPAEESPSPSPEPPVPVPGTRPSTSLELNFIVDGVTETEFYNVQSQFTASIAKAAGVPPEWAEVDEVEAVSSSARRLLQDPSSLQTYNTIYSNDLDESESMIKASVADGSLAESLREIGMILVPDSVEISQDSSSSTNVGAIVGGVVGGVCGLILILAVIWFIVKKKKSAPLKAEKVGKIVEGQKTGQPMFVENTAFEESDDAPKMKESTKEEFKMHQSAAFRSDVSEGTPRDSLVGGVAMERSQSDLSDADGMVYTPSDVSGAQTSRSRLDSARSGLKSNPAFATPREIADTESSDEEPMNPMFAKESVQTARSSAPSDGLEIDSSRRYESANESQKTSARTGFSNAFFNAEDDDGNDANPLFDKKQKK